LLVEAESVRYRGRLSAPSHAELGEDVGEVEAGRLLGDEQFFTDLPIGPPLGNEYQYLDLASGQAQ